MRAIVLALFLSFQDGARIEDLIRDLGSTEYAERQKAKEGLLKIGAPAVAALEKATQSSDPEVAQSAKDLLAEIRKAGSLSNLLGSGRRVSIHVRDVPFETAAEQLASSVNIRFPESARGVKLSLDFENAPLIQVLDAMTSKTLTYRFENSETVQFFEGPNPGIACVYSGPFKFSVTGIATSTSRDHVHRSADVDMTIAAEWEPQTRPAAYSIELIEAQDADGRPVKANTAVAEDWSQAECDTVVMNGATFKMLNLNGRTKLVTEKPAAVLGEKTLNLARIPTAVSKFASLRCRAVFEFGAGEARTIKFDRPSVGSRDGGVEIVSMDAQSIRLRADECEVESIVLDIDGREVPVSMDRRGAISVPKGKTVSALCLSVRERVKHSVEFEFKDLDLR